MAVGVIIIATLSIVATVIGTLALIPVISELGTNDAGHWAKFDKDNDGIPDEDNIAIQSRDRAFQAIVVLPVFLIGAIITWAFLAVTRRDFGEV